MLLKISESENIDENIAQVQFSKPSMSKKSPQAKVLTRSRNYMKPTSSSYVRRERLQVALHSSSTEDEKTNPMNLKPIRSSVKKSNAKKATCSSTLKESKFAKDSDLHKGKAEEERTSVIKVCSYRYCPLHGHRNTPLPSFESFLSSRRRLLATQKSMKLTEPSLVRKRNSGSTPHAEVHNVFAITSFEENEDENCDISMEKELQKKDENDSSRYLDDGIDDTSIRGENARHDAGLLHEEAEKGDDVPYNELNDESSMIEIRLSDSSQEFIKEDLDTELLSIVQTQERSTRRNPESEIDQETTEIGGNISKISE